MDHFFVVPPYLVGLVRQLFVAVFFRFVRLRLRWRRGVMLAGCLRHPLRARTVAVFFLRPPARALLASVRRRLLETPARCAWREIVAVFFHYCTIVSLRGIRSIL